MNEDQALTLESLVERSNELTRIITDLETQVASITTQYSGLVTYINDNFKKSNNTLKTLDNLTFMAVMKMVEHNEKFELNPENITSTAAQIKAIVTMFNDYRDKLNEESDKQEALEAKKANKRAEVAAKRALRKGKVTKDATAN